MIATNDKCPYCDFPGEDQIGDVYKIFLAILCSISVMLIVGTALVVKISNTGMMYR